jgi:S1-C subfamily serine protease
MLKWILPIILFSTVSLAQQASPSPTVDNSDERVLFLESFENQDSATGFLLKVNNEIVLITAAHMCVGEDYLDAFNQKMTLQMPAKIKKIEKKYDLCMLTSYQNVKAFDLGQSLMYKDKITVIGYPLGEPQTIENGDVYISYTEKKMYQQLWKMNVFVTILNIDGIKPGSSGSPVLDKDGKVVGVVVGVYKDKPMASIVPLVNLKDFLGIP